MSASKAIEANQGERAEGRAFAPIPSRILVPVDFSAGSALALEHALVLARRFGASVEAVHVLRPAAPIGADAAVVAPGEHYQSMAEWARSQASEALADLLAMADRRGIRIRGRIEDGRPDEVILTLARNEGIDLIVMGTHGRTGLSRMLMGSVAEKVVRRAACPVLTVRSDEGSPGGAS